PIEISDAIRHQIQDELSRAKDEQSQSLRKEYDALSEARVVEAVAAAVERQKQEAELALQKERAGATLELERAKQQVELEVQKARQVRELELERLRGQMDAARQSETLLREQTVNLIEELDKARREKESAQLEARREMLEKERLIREEAILTASENFNTKIREQEETIGKLREQLTTAKLVAEQGSQQLQGEILELDIERSLKENFPMDTVDEVKKGERGTDIRQVVNDLAIQNCGLILWECKNAKTFQAGWLVKMKETLAEEKAQFGILVFAPAGGGGEDYRQLAENIWLVKPRYAVMMAAFLREGLIRVAVANRNAEGKDVKIEMIYDYLTGGEFNNRVRSIIESYDEMARQLELEKKQAQKRWAAQEKILQKVTSGLYGMSGDLQGIAGRDIIALPGHAEEEMPDDD
ncbi:MAG: DUF2130 domain-containing protein, partial [Clostridiales bacterium]|nr:DUF2130 domain-containing protein [Clostridiales bacterium]